MGARRVIPAQGPGRGREICWCEARLLMFSPPLQPGKLRLQRQTYTEKPNSPLPGSSRFNASKWLCLAFPGTGVVGVSDSQRCETPQETSGGWRRQSRCRGWWVPGLGTRAPSPSPLRAQPPEPHSSPVTSINLSPQPAALGS